ncbi:MAG: UvrB/UvrC motif-containing protein [Oscillospiraceae bacterium]|nr:UvrB/UvrC motif-containing protein [Oscillospiraceae bacterium]
MKCTRCGKNEVNFFYKSNINGEITEHNLCTECAQEMGLMRDVFAESRQLMRGFFEDSFERLASPFTFGARDFLRLGERKQEEPCGCSKCEEKAEVDPEIAKRREINALRHQMKMAARAEDFEKAAELRDKIRSLEG